MKHIDGMQGVRGRNSENSLGREVLVWEPVIDRHEALSRTYPWIEERARPAYFPDHAPASTAR